jgi:hypothetical protein
MAGSRTRGAALQVGEFAVGVATAYVAVGGAWAVTGSLWAPILMAFALVGVATIAEFRYGARVTGLVAGLLSAAVLTAGALWALWLILGRLSS